MTARLQISTCIADEKNEVIRKYTPKKGKGLNPF